jgi:hypothetical protein
LKWKIVSICFLCLSIKPQTQDWFSPFHPIWIEQWSLITKHLNSILSNTELYVIKMKLKIEYRWENRTRKLKSFQLLAKKMKEIFLKSSFKLSWFADSWWCVKSKSIGKNFDLSFAKRMFRRAVFYFCDSMNQKPWLTRQYLAHFKWQFSLLV